jgi:AcrR family transcriptional regulator
MRKNAETKGSRNRVATERRLLDALRAELIDGGYEALGVNGIARRAGCDKQLIYRYFGGLEGLIDAFAGEMSGWIVRALESVDLSIPSTYGEVVKAGLCAFLDALRSDPAMVRLLGAELTGPSPQVLRMSLERGRELSAWVNARTAEISPPEGRDGAAINAILIAAIQHLVMSAAATKRFSGLALENDSDWERVRATVCTLVDAVYSLPRES